MTDRRGGESRWGGTLGVKVAVDELLCREILSEPLVYLWGVVGGWEFLDDRNS